MQIRIGYELIYDCPQPTPMLLTLHVHYTRVSTIVVPDHLITRPSIPITSYRDAFGNWCSRIVAPTGEIRLSADAVVNDTGEPDVVAAQAPQHQVQELPEEVLPFLLGSRYCETDLLSEMGPIRHIAHWMETRPGHLRFRSSTYRFWLRARPRHEDGLGSFQPADRGLPRFHAPGHHILPLHEHSGTLLHWLP